MRRQLTCTVLAALVLAAPARADFDWQAVEGLPDVDHNQRPDRAQTPQQAGTPDVRLRLQVTGDACERSGPFTWTLDDRPLVVSPAGPCSFLTGAVAEGPHRLTLDAGDGARPTTRDVIVVEHLIVSIGDSVASGEGNPDEPADLRPAQWLERRCHRSLRSGPAVAARAIEASGMDSTVTFVPLGCSGATVRMGLTETYDGIEPDREHTLERPQVTVVGELRAQREIDAVLVSVGANDVYFGKVVQFCAAVPDCNNQHFDSRHPRRRGSNADPTLDQAITDALDRLATAYDELNAALTKDIPRSRIIIVEYFDPTIGIADASAFCRVNLHIGVIQRDESEWAHERLLQRLNDLIAAKADEHGWTLVDGVAEAFAGHGICAQPAHDVWVRTPEASFFKQDARAAFSSIAGTLHPNGPGHRAISRSIVPRLAAVLRTAVPDKPDHDSNDENDNRWFGTRTTILLIVVALAIVGGAGFWIIRYFRHRT